MRIICAPSSVLAAASGTWDARYSLYSKTPNANVGYAGNDLIDKIRLHKLKPDPLAWDFLSLALAIMCADNGAIRDNSPDGWTREIDLTISLSNSRLWKKHIPLLEEALRFLTTDIWRLNVIDGGLLPVPKKDHILRDEDSISLLSGGLDSLVGGIDLKASGINPIFVSQIAKGDATNQINFSTSIAGPNHHLQFNHNVRTRGKSDRSQRARSIIFIAYGILAATSLKSYSQGSVVDLFIPENGLISLNIPLTPLRLGSHSTRTTHPFYLSKLQNIFDNVGLRVKISNPYQFVTKGEMLANCKDQALLSKFAMDSTSCGRFLSNGYTQCGRCVPCLIRRASIHRWGKTDTSGYAYEDLSRNDPRFRHFDDVKSMSMALSKINQLGLTAWTNGSLNTAQIGKVSPYEKVIDRSMQEMQSFFKSSGLI